MDPLEALADGVMVYEGWGPGSRNWRNRNPGNIERAGEYAIYATLSEGWDALRYDLVSKCSGRNRHGLGPDSTLRQMMNVYAPASDNNQPDAYANFLAGHMTRATGKKFTAESRLGDIYP